MTSKQMTSSNIGIQSLSRAQLPDTFVPALVCNQDNYQTFGKVTVLSHSSSVISPYRQMLQVSLARTRNLTY